MVMQELQDTQPKFDQFNYITPTKHMVILSLTNPLREAKW